MRLKKGFTLIEILVSMTILVLTISIALFATIGSNGLIQKADTRSAITESGRTINDTLQTMVVNLAVGTVGFLGSANGSSTYNGIYVKSYSASQTVNVCQAVGRATATTNSNGNTTYAFDSNGTALAYWVMPINSNLLCPTTDLYPTISTFQNQLTSSKTRITDAQFYLTNFACQAGASCNNSRQGLRYSYTLELIDKSVGLSKASQQASVQTTSTIPIGLINQAITPLNIDTLTLADGTTGVLYSQTVQATGGLPSYTWSILSGILPPGLVLAANSGIISGTPTTAGSYSFVVKVVDSKNRSDSQSLTITIAQGIAPLVISSTSPLPSGITGTLYNYQFNATGGTLPYSWSLQSGSLPTGFTLSSSGLLSGTTSSSGTYTFTVKVTDASAATDSKQFSLVIASKGPISP